MNFLRKYQGSFLASFVFIVFTLFFFGVYEARTLNGDIDNHILAGDMFGVPAELKSHGIKPLYYGAGQTGWDGQFYYYISNDIFALKDTASHVDAPSYRYQRVGLPLYVALVSAVAGNSWVSPSTFFISYFCLVLSATFVGACLFARFGLNPFLILLWALSVGTQVTLFNALPDAAADAFLILALALLFSGRLAWSTIPFVFSALSREVYVLFPSLIAFCYLINLIVADGSGGIKRIANACGYFVFNTKYCFLLLPGVVAVCWNLYITNHFGVTPSSQAHGILGFPLSSWFQYLLSGLSGNHKLLGKNVFAYAEAVALVLFLLVLCVSFWALWKLLKDRPLSVSAELGGVALASGCIAVLYVCFGPTVMMHYTGYFKAIAVFFFLIPFFLSSFSVTRFEKWSVYSLLLVSVVFTTFYNAKVKIFPFSSGNEDITRMGEISDRPRVECFGVYNAEVSVNSISFSKSSIVSYYFGGGDKIVVDLDLKNTGEYPFWSTRNFGSVFMSYHWVDSERRVIKDGVRSVIVGGLLPGQTKRVAVVSDLPQNIHGEASLVLSPVQEGCSWFYLANPKVSGEIKISVK